MKVGTAAAVITPPVGLDLSGWSFGPSVAVHDELHAKAIYFEATNGGKFLLITADLIGLDTVVADSIRGKLADAIGMSNPDIMIICSHTHSGPATMFLRRWGTIERGYLRKIALSLFDVGVRAVDAAAGGDARLGFAGIPISGICVNRRGDVGNNVDEELGILHIENTGKPYATVLNYSCHPVAAHNYNNVISADYPGFAAKLIDSARGPDHTTFFTLGAAGDINPVAFHHIRYAEEYGTRLGRAVTSGLPNLQMMDSPNIASATLTVGLPVQELPEAQYLENEMSISRAEAAKLSGERAKRNTIDNALINAEWAEEALEIVKAGNQARYLEMELQAVGIGDLGFLALPVELFVDIGRSIKTASPFAHTLIVEMANGSLCYLPTSVAYRRGGYETEFSAKVYGTYMLTEEAQALVENGAAELLNTVWSELRGM